MYSYTLSLIPVLHGVRGQGHDPAASPPGKTRYPLYWMGPRDGLGVCGKFRVASRNFNTPSDHLISNTVICKVRACRVMFFDTSHRKPHTHSHPTSVSEADFSRIIVFKNSPLKGFAIEIFC